MREFDGLPQANRSLGRERVAGDLSGQRRFYIVCPQDYRHAEARERRDLSADESVIENDGGERSCGVQRPHLLYETGVGAKIDAGRLPQPRPGEGNLVKPYGFAVLCAEIDAVVIPDNRLDPVAQRAQRADQVQRANALAGMRRKRTDIARIKDSGLNRLGLHGLQALTAGLRGANLARSRARPAKLPAKTAAALCQKSLQAAWRSSVKLCAASRMPTAISKTKDSAAKASNNWCRPDERRSSAGPKASPDISATAPASRG